MGSSSKDSFRPPADQPAPSGQMTPTPGGGAPNWNSILPQSGAPAQLSDPFRSEPNGPPALSPATASASTPPAGAATSTASNAVPAAVANLPPEQRAQYMAAKAAGNDELAARILLAATMMGAPVNRNADRSGGMGMGAPSGGGPGPGWGGGVAGGVGGRTERGGLY